MREGERESVSLLKLCKSCIALISVSYDNKNTDDLLGSQPVAIKSAHYGSAF